jgi:hypothetical protein
MSNGNFVLSVRDEQQKLATFFLQRTLVSVYARYVLDAILVDAQFGQSPAWFVALAGELEGLRGQARIWFDSVAPPLTALPQTYIDMSNAHAGQLPALTAAMKRLIANRGHHDDGEIQAITTICNSLLATIRAQGTAVGNRSLALQGYGGSLNLAIKAMTDGAASINAAIIEEKEAIHDTSQLLQALQSQLAADVRGLIGSAVVGGVGLAGGIVSIVLTVGGTLTGPGAVVGCIVAVVAAIAGIVATGLLAANVVADQQGILEKQAQLSTEGQQLVELNGLSATVKALLDAYQDPFLDLSPLTRTWSTLADNLEAVRDLIVAERTDETGLAAILGDLQTLGSDLERLTGFATTLQNAALAGDSAPTQVLTIAQAAAA